MKKPRTLFGGQKVVFDAMVIIHFHGLLSWDKLADWAQGEIVVEKIVRSEAKYSKAGPIDLSQIINDGRILEEEVAGNRQEHVFLDYLRKGINGVIIHKGEAACLALAIDKGYGLATDERVVREEFARRCPQKICLSSRQLADRAVREGFISKAEADDLKKGMFYV